MTDEVLKKILDIDGKVEIPFIVMKSLRKVRGFKVGDVITFDGNIPLNTKFKFNSLPPGGQKVCRNKEEVLRMNGYSFNPVTMIVVSLITNSNVIKELIINRCHLR